MCKTNCVSLTKKYSTVFLHGIYNFLFPKNTNNHYYVFLPVLVSLCISIYLYMTIFSMYHNNCGSYYTVCTPPLKFLPWGGLYPGKILDNGWRLITYAFHHYSFIHLFSNLIIFTLITYYLEKKYGSIRIFLIFILSSVGAGLIFWWLWVDQNLLLSGASAGIFGLIGTEIVDLIINFETVNDVIWNSLLIISGLITIIVNLIMNNGVEGICHFLGGLLGTVCSFILIPDFHYMRWKLIPIIIALIFFILVYIALPIYLTYRK